MAFFNEFPHTRTYDSDLAWLIKRMKEVLARLDEAIEAVNSIPQKILDALNELINNGSIESLIEAAVAGDIYTSKFTGDINDTDGVAIAKDLRAQVYLQKKSGTLSIEFTAKYANTGIGRGSFLKGSTLDGFYAWIESLIGLENYLDFGYDKNTVITNFASFCQICTDPTESNLGKQPRQYFTMGTNSVRGYGLYGYTGGLIPSGTTNGSTAPYVYRLTIPFVVKPKVTP